MSDTPVGRWAPVKARWQWCLDHWWVFVLLAQIVLFFPPTAIQDLPAALRAGAGHGITGTFRLDYYHSGKSAGFWRGEFRSDDGRTVLHDIDLDGLDGHAPKGSSVPAFVITTRHSFWGRTAYTGANANYLWQPIGATVFWTALAAAWPVRLHVLRRRRRPVPPPPPATAHLPPADTGNVRAISLRLRQQTLGNQGGSAAGEAPPSRPPTAAGQVGE
ncbi:hypothetical protein [Krasilnikovia sp. MM14-A1004]|uniref:hypothetical protein n=1 Tax=Krasilnikovia sp. MM14-A1004 TaxID=3373541 RepID=UPI00399C567E